MFTICETQDSVKQPSVIYPQVEQCDALDSTNYDPCQNEGEENYYMLQDYEFEDTDTVVYPSDDLDNEGHPSTFTAYKRVDKKVHPVSGTFPEAARVIRKFPHDPLADLPPLPICPPEFVPTPKITQERLEILEINKDGFLSPEEEKLFKHVMWLNQDGIAFADGERGTLKESYFSPYIIPTIPHTPWVYKNIPIPPGIHDKVIELLRLKIEAGVYEPSQSSYRSRWFCVLKKNGTLRIVHDLQPLNRVTIRDAGLPPILDDFVEPFAGRQCYTVFDLFWGFDARKVHPASRDLTAFFTPRGLLRITSLPMGFTNSPAEFQNCMKFILQDETVANIFIDDLPIKGPSTTYPDDQGNPEVLAGNPGIRRFIWEHALDVHRVMHRVKKAGGTFAAKKSQICRPSVIILGQKCTPEGRSPDDDKVSKVHSWPPLQTPKEVRGFLGLCGTVRIWIKDFSHLARPLTELFRKDADFVWDERRKEAFALLKQKVASAPALHPIDYQADNPVILSVDTSYIATGFILSQIDDKGRRRPARYGSLPMNEREARYSQPKLELYGLYRALRHWRIYLIGVKHLFVEVDAKYIKGMLNEPDLQPNAAINRWIQGILMFDFTLVHVPATQFKGPDALSRRGQAEDEEFIVHDDSWLDDIALSVFTPHHRQFENFHFSIPEPCFNTDLSVTTLLSEPSRQEQLLLEAYRFLTTLRLPTIISLRERKRLLKKASEYYIKEDKMFKRNGNRSPLLVVFDQQLRLDLLTQAHEKLGHKGEQAVFEILRLRFFWPHLRAAVRHHVSSCHECQIRSLKKMEIPLTVSTPTTLFEKVYVDVMFMPPSAGFHFIVAAKDDLTGVTEARALRLNNSQSLAKFFWEQIYCRYGAIGHVVTDNGSEVKGAFQILLQRMGVPQVHISPYNKRANGVVERGHFILREAIVKSCEKDSHGQIKNWHKHLEMAVFADRVTVSSVTGYSPYFLLHGIHPLLPFDLSEATFMVDGFRSGLSTTELLTLRIRQLTRHQEDIQQAADTLRKARFKSKQHFEQRYRKRLQRKHYSPGELVLVRNTRLESSVARLKTEPRYFGPYVVVERTRGGAYVLEELDGALHAEHYAAFRLLPYIRRNDPVLRTLFEDDQPYLLSNLEHTDLDLPDDSDHQSDITDSDSGSH